MDGRSTIAYLKSDNTAGKLPYPTQGAFDTAWLYKIADLSNTITNELKAAIAKGWKLSLTEEQAADGRTQSVVTVEAKSGLPESDYLKNKFFDDSDTRRVYRFDAQTELLQSVQVYLVRASGEVLIFEVNQIDCNQPIDPDVFRLELPVNVVWEEELQKLPDNEKYAAMTAEQAARAFFEACAREDWDEAGKFMSPVTPDLKQYLGGLEILSLGQAFTSRAYDPTGRFVPYQIKLKNGGVKKHNLALKKDKKTSRWYVDGGI